MRRVLPLALRRSLSLRGPRKGRSRDPKRGEIGLLDSCQRLGKLPVDAHLEHQHSRKFGHHHERGRLQGLLFVPSWQRIPRRLHMHPQCALHQTPQQQRQQ
jgi:hypothetical protein